jgi:hypothetical protein
MVILGLLGVVLANIGFFSGIETGVLEGFYLASPGITIVGYALFRLAKDIERLSSESTE